MAGHASGVMASLNIEHLRAASPTGIMNLSCFMPVAGSSSSRLFYDNNCFDGAE